MTTRRRPKIPAKFSDPRIAVAYLRLSIDEKREEMAARTHGLDAQRNEILEWAAKHNIAVVAIFEDKGVSGDTDLADRPGLSAALADVEKRRAGMLLVWKRDRLARDVMVAAIITRELERRGAVVRSIQGEGTDVAGPAGQLVAAVVDAAAQYELAMVRTRTRAGLRARRNKGFAPPTPPFGYSKDDQKRMVPCEPEQRLLARAKELRAQGLAYREVARMLEAEGHRNRHGMPVAFTMLHKVMHREEVRAEREADLEATFHGTGTE